MEGGKINSDFLRDLVNCTHANRFYFEACSYQIFYVKLIVDEHKYESAKSKCDQAEQEDNYCPLPVSSKKCWEEPKKQYGPREPNGCLLDTSGMGIFHYELCVCHFFFLTLFPVLGIAGSGWGIRTAYIRLLAAVIAAMLRERVEVTLISDDIFKFLIVADEMAI